MKPSWDNAPKWARSLAQEEDGCWYWFESWYPAVHKHYSSGKSPRFKFAGQDEYNPDWADTWEHRPHPCWDDAPDWAQYLAQKRNGRWDWYERSPDLFHMQYSMGLFPRCRFAGINEPNPNWKKMLEQRP